MANGDGTFMTKDQKIDTYIMLLVDGCDRATSILNRIQLEMEMLDQNPNPEDAQKIREIIKSNIKNAKSIMNNYDQIGEKLKTLVHLENE